MICIYIFFLKINQKNTSVNYPMKFSLIIYNSKYSNLKIIATLKDNTGCPAKMSLINTSKRIFSKILFFNDYTRKVNLDFGFSNKRFLSKL